MPIVVSVAGRSNSGKTTLLEKLIGELKRRGHKVAAVKHSIHDVDLDQPGKDSWRLARAGSDAVVVSSPKKISLNKKLDQEASVEQILSLLGNEYDVILLEGFKGARIPRIEVHRRELGELVCPPGEVIATITDEPLDVDVPQFSADQIGLLADFLEGQLASPTVVTSRVTRNR
jgi:molybdopterin-guanine dinucleotide biosynthesis protein MobB